MAKSKKRATAVGRPPTNVAEWAYRFPYTPPPAIEKGPSPPETRWTPLLPTKARQVSRENRRLRGRRKVHGGTRSTRWVEASDQVRQAVARV
jgi:hypothetical protein